MKAKIFLISLLIFNSIILKAQNENSSTHRNLFLSTCCGEFSLADATKSSMIDTIFCERWDFSAKSFVPDNMTVNIYDAKGRMKESLSGYYYTNGAFKYLSRYEFTYFPFDSLLSETFYYWSDTMNGTGDWDNRQRFEYTYDMTLKLIEIETWFSGIGTNAWESRTREHYYYGSNGLIDDISTEYWNPDVNAWWFYLRYRYVYDQNDNVITKYYDYSNNASGTWSNSSRLVFNYAKDQKQEIQQVYTDPDWRNVYRKTYSLSNTGLTEEIFKESWDIQSSVWDTMFNERDLYYYNSSDQLEEHISMSSYIQWFNVARETYTYDANGELTERIEYQWNHNANSWEARKRCTYLSTPIILSFSSNEAVEFNIYPNPTSDYLNIVPGDEISGEVNIHLLNTSGQVMKELYQNNNDLIRMDLSGYPSGVYFVQIQINGKTSVVRKIFFQ